MKTKFTTDIKHGSPEDPVEYSKPHLTPGKLTLKGGETIEYDVYLPAYN